MGATTAPESLGTKARLRPFGYWLIFTVPALMPVSWWLAQTTGTWLWTALPLVWLYGVLPLADLRDLKEYAVGVGARIHLDGARLWNAHVATGTPLAEYGACADVISVCFSKGLGAPVGSMLVASRDVVAETRVWRKRMGGGMRQVGVLAAAAEHALDHHVERLAEDHAHARLLAEACGVDPAGVETNIVVVPRRDAADAASYVTRAAEQGVRVATVGPTTVRLVTHLDVSRDDAERAAAVLARL